MDKEIFYRKLEEICELDHHAIKGGEILSYGGVLDSISMLGLIAVLDKEFHVRMSPDEILNVGSVNDLYNRVFCG